MTAPSAQSVETARGLITAGSRRKMLIAAFLAWMFAGLEISLFILIHRQMMVELLGPNAAEKVITQWFAWYQAAFLFGAAAGGWFFGWLGDRSGRTRSMACCVLCYSGLTLVAWFVHDPMVMWAVRFTACLGIGGAWPNAVALVAEACPSTSRPWLAGLLGSAANFGFVLLGVVGYYCQITNDDWRWVLLVGAAPLVIGIWILTAVPESSAWLASQKAESSGGRDTQKPVAPVSEVFRQPLLYRTLLGISLGAVPLIGTAANANWVVPWTDQVTARASQQQTSEAGNPALKTVAAKKTDPRQKAKTQILRSSGAILGSLLGGAIASFLGRRITYFLISVCTFLISTWIFGYLTPQHPQFSFFTFLLGFFGVTYFGWLPLFLPELFPVRVRSTGSGISFNTGRVIAAVVVLFVGFRMDDFQGDYAKIGLWSGMIYVVGMIIIWFAPSQSDTIPEKTG